MRKSLVLLTVLPLLTASVLSAQNDGGGLQFRIAAELGYHSYNADIAAGVTGDANTQRVSVQSTTDDSGVGFGGRFEAVLGPWVIGAGMDYERSQHLFAGQSSTVNTSVDLLGGISSTVELDLANYQLTRKTIYPVLELGREFQLFDQALVLVPTVGASYALEGEPEIEGIQQITRNGIIINILNPIPEIIADTTTLQDDQISVSMENRLVYRGALRLEKPLGPGRVRVRVDYQWESAITRFYQRDMTLRRWAFQVGYVFPLGASTTD